MNRETFLKSVKERAVQRIKEGRTRVVDLLALPSVSFNEEEFCLKDPVIYILEVFEEKDEWIEVQKNLEDVPTESDYWNDVRFIVNGYQRYKLSDPEMRNLLESKSKPELREMLAGIGSKKRLGDEYWVEVDFMLNFLLKLKSIEEKRLEQKPAKLVGVEAYVEWRRKRTTEGDTQLVKSGYDNCPAALEFAKNSGASPLSLHASTSPAANAVIPRFHARVFMTIPWTRHNRAFYDQLNPPQAIPIGYEFKIFYPLLPKTPRYVVEVLNEEYSLLWVHPPDGNAMYKSLAFKVKREEWDRGTWGEDGFRSQYDAHLLHLRFWFKGKRGMKPV